MHHRDRYSPIIPEESEYKIETSMSDYYILEVQEQPISTEESEFETMIEVAIYEMGINNWTLEEAQPIKYILKKPTDIVSMCDDF